MIYLELDNFKHTNNKFGQAEGDLAFKAFAGQMQKSFRDSDALARMGGAEFEVLMSGASMELAEDINKRFKLAIDEYNRRAEVTKFRSLKAFIK